MSLILSQTLITQAFKTGVEAVTEVKGNCRKAPGSDIRWQLEGEAHVPWRRWELWGFKLKLWPAVSQLREGLGPSGHCVSLPLIPLCSVSGGPGFGFCVDL